MYTKHYLEDEREGVPGGAVAGGNRRWARGGRMDGTGRAVVAACGGTSRSGCFLVLTIIVMQFLRRHDDLTRSSIVGVYITFDDGRWSNEEEKRSVTSAF
jgi:hypothetical protein